MNSTRPEAKDSLGFARQSSWPEEPFDVVWSAGSLFTLFAHQKIGRVKSTHRHADCFVSEDRTDDFDTQAHDAAGELTTR
jgi:hypothetical protein